jgi:hypothetical protein
MRRSPLMRRTTDLRSLLVHTDVISLNASIWSKDKEVVPWCHCVHLQNRRSRVRIPPGWKVWRSLLQCCCHNLICIVFVCICENKCFQNFFKASKKIVFRSWSSPQKHESFTRTAEIRPIFAVRANDPQILHFQNIVKSNFDKQQKSLLEKKLKLQWMPNKLWTWNHGDHQRGVF